jgi:hypothetical protein
LYSILRNFTNIFRHIPIWIRLDDNNESSTWSSKFFLAN